MVSVGRHLTLCLILLLIKSHFQQNTETKRCHSKFHSCLGEHGDLLCQCDSGCEYYDDCCYDARKVTTTASEKLEYINKASCELVNFGKLVSVNTNIGTFMVSSCPESWKTELDIKNECENNISGSDIKDMVPVLDFSTSVTFKNRHCAKCNKVQNWVPWNFESHCGIRSFLFNRLQKTNVSLAESVEFVIQDEDCGYRFVPPELAKTRKCFQNFEYNVWSTLTNFTNTTCGNRVLKPVMYQHDIYRNIHCVVEAVNISFDTVSENVQCFMNTNEGMIISWTSKLTLISVINITSLLKTADGRCDDKEITLSNKGVCHRLYCPINMEPYAGRCRNVISSSDGKILDLLFEANMDLEQENSILKSVFNQFLRAVLAELGKCMIYSGELYAHKIPTEVFFGKNVTSNQTCSLARIRYPLKIKAGTNKCSTQVERNLIFKVAKHYKRAFSHGNTITHVTDVTKSLCRVNVTLSNPVYVMEQYWTGNHLPCPAVKVRLLGGNISNLHAMTLLNTASVGKMYFDLNGVVIDASDVVYYNHKFYLCVATYSSKYHISYVTPTITASNCISMLGLLFCLIQYCIVPFMRKRKGDLIFIIISFSLLFHVPFLMISYVNKVSQFCEWLGLLHHLTWLGNFVFTFMCSYRLYKEIRSGAGPFINFRKTIRHICVGFVIIFINVTSTKLINPYATSSENWYGSEMCFISNSSILFLAFVLPISFILYGNRIVFGRIITHTSSGPTLCERKIGAKLIVLMLSTAIMACTWIFEIVVLLHESKILLTIFKIVASLQGLFLTITFVSNHRNLK